MLVKYKPANRTKYSYCNKTKVLNVSNYGLVNKIIALKTHYTYKLYV